MNVWNFYRYSNKEDIKSLLIMVYTWKVPDSSSYSTTQLHHNSWYDFGIKWSQWCVKKRHCSSAMYHLILRELKSVFFLLYGVQIVHPDIYTVSSQKLFYKYNGAWKKWHVCMLTKYPCLRKWEIVIHFNSPMWHVVSSEHTHTHLMHINHL